MKKTLIVFLVLFYLGTILLAQGNNPTFPEIQKIADRTAGELWGKVFPDEPIPYYSKNDELIGYRFNYSINTPFPENEKLKKNCKEAYENNNQKIQWGNGRYGNIFISARTDLPVINDYSKALSPEYAMGFKLEDIAKSVIGQDVKLQRVYYINFVNQWFCFSNSQKEVFICVFPETQSLDSQEFAKLAESLDFFCTKGDFTNEWNQYLKGNIKPGKAEVWIPNHDDNCKFYDWSYGCTPTAAAILLSYWDYNSINTTNNYSKLIDYHFQRWDGIEGMEWDYQVPNAQEELAIAMGTDPTGTTDRNDIAPGYAYVCNQINGYNFNCTYHDEGGDYVWYFNKIQDEINAGRPIHISIPDHSECCVAYDASTNLIGVHNTWWPPVQWINRNQLEAVYTIVPGSPHGLAINLIHPAGDTNYNQNTNGESFLAGDVYEIMWNSDYEINSYVKLFYSLDGGYNWTQISGNTSNDGLYDWVLPTGLSSSSCRIQSQIWSSGTYSGSDASFGNFKIFPGGYIETLYAGVVDITNLNPDYYLFNHPHQTWCAIGVRCTDPGEDWDISMFDDNTFNNVIASSMNGALDPVDFIVMDGHHTPVQDRGIKVSRFSGNGNGHVQYKGVIESINMGDNYYSWSPNGVVEMFDVYLASGEYKFTLNLTYGSTDLDIALFKSNGTAYYANRNNYFAGSFNPGMGVPEEFTCTIISSDHYGFCVWNNDNYLVDYCIKLEKAGTWTGDSDINWHNPANWTAGIVPNASTDVIIPETTNKPWVYATDAACNSLTIYHGTGANFLKVFDEDLHVYGDLNIYGELILDHPAGRLIVEGKVNWESGSTAYFPYYDEFLVYGDWHFKDGANVQINNGTVEFVGTGGNYIYSDDADCYFNNISCNKTGAGWLSFSNASTSDLNINGDLNIEPNSLIFSSNPNSVVLKGDLNISGALDCNHGTFVFDGGVQNINENLSYSTSCDFNWLKISSSVSTTIQNKAINIKGRLDIEEGQFISNSHTITIGGDWYNSVGPTGFDEGTGRVIFNHKTFHQSCYNETFYTLEIDKNPNIVLTIGSQPVECTYYDWTAGGIEVYGSFTALDLVDDGIYGQYFLNSGTINLTNYDGHIDLNGELYITGGVMNIYGGAAYSFWPNDSDAAIHMSNGILDFRDQGIIIYSHPTYTLTENITGGIIRTARGFFSLSDAFTPEGGLIEFYGGWDVFIGTPFGSHFNNVLINKSAKSHNTFHSQSQMTANPIVDERIGKVLDKGTKSNTLSLDDVLDIHGWLQIDDGTLNSNGYNIYMKGYWVNYAGDAGFTESTGAVIFYGEGSAIYSDETFNNLIITMLDPVYNTLGTPEGTMLNINNLFIADGYFVFNHNVELNVSGDITMNNGGIDASWATNPTLTIGGNYTDNNVEVGFYPGDETIIFNGNGDQEIFAAYGYALWNNLTIEKTGGDFKPNSAIAVFGDLNISTGDWLDNTTGLAHNFFGDFTIGSSGNYYPAGYTVFAGNGDQYYTTNGGLGYFGDIVIDKSGKGKILKDKNILEFIPEMNKDSGSKSMTVYLNSDMVVFNDHATELFEGTLDLNGHSYKATGLVVIHDGGNLIVDAGATLSMHHHMFVQDGGTFTTAGTLGNNARVHADGSGNYAIEITLGGTISSTYTVFEDLEPTGLWVHNNAFVDPLNCFNHCSFDGYTNPPGSSWLIIDTDQVLTIDNISFPNNPGGSNAHNIAKIDNHGHITLTQASGDFSGPMYEDDFHDRIDWVESEIELDLTVILEGPFNGVDMYTSLNDLDTIPFSQPYNIPPWNYPGSENVESIPNGDVVDWILIEIRDALDAPLAIPSTILRQQAAFILNDGSIVDLDGLSNPKFNNVPIDHLFLIVKHRNHLGIMTALPLTETDGVYNYNFTTPAGQAYGTNSQKNLGSGQYGLYGGDANADGNVNTNDKTVWSNQAGKFGYESTDFNLDGQVNNSDKNDYWHTNNGQGTYIPH